ncbi:D-alanine--D-alanine ligase family protein [Amnibacterium kyonggiense]|uniref:D-alanine--D-alanine ligase n=1 Tax=Amnibacterium kyonggiense TaxID=595671 RepID=A0A4R7FQG0_9MICO|nr:D-alanine--D-alanine ligase [Amnibacterium kyonggiense]TDS79839.1 D-alanine-D-alanine ligase [Amnibacterium kyonggiense]
MAGTTPSVVVLSGGISHERDVSLRSGRRVVDALARLGWAVTTAEPDARLLTALLEQRPDVVWPALHGASGEDGSLRALLDVSGLTYIGSRGPAARLAWDKPTAKRIVSDAGGTTPASVTLTREVFREIGARSAIDTILGSMSEQLVVKPARGGSAQGVTVVDEAQQLPRALMDAFTYADEALIEQRITGTEVAVGVLDGDEGAEALPAVEIVPRSGFYGFEERYTAGATRFYTPARVPAEVAEAAGDLAVVAHRAMGLRHLSRADLVIDGEGRPWFLESNVMPGLTETSLLPQALLSTGRDLSSAYAAITQRALAGA